MSIYWTLLYELDIARPEVAANPTRIWLARIIHSVPLFTVLINFAYSNLHMEKHDGVIMIPVAFVYGYVNKCGAEAHGQLIYPFFNWNKPYEPYVVLMVLVVAKYALWYGIATVSMKIKPIKSE